MAIEPSSARPTALPRPASSPSWLHARALWAGLSIIAMWLAVLFVGIFGGDFVSNSSSNGFTKIPVVVFVLPFVLVATIVVARRGFAPDQRHRAPEEDIRALEEPVAEPPSLRAKPA